MQTFWETSVPPSIFAVAAPGARSLGYAKFARHVGLCQGIYKLQALAPLADRRPLTMAELRGLAEQYVAGMRAIQGNGPYYLIAMCGGCQIAEQMILQLEAHGQEVKVFVILDTWVMEFVHRRWGWRLLGYHQRLDWLRRATTRERLNWVTRALTNRLRTWAGKVKPSQAWKDAYWPRYFKPPRFRAPIVLFKRPKQPYYYIDDPTMGWGARSQGGVEIHEINAAHHEFLREPYAEIISRVLMTRLPSSPSLADEWATGSVLANEVTAVTAD